MTSSGSFFKGLFEEKIASKASVVEVGGTVVVTEIGRWMEKNDATCTSDKTKKKSTSAQVVFLCLKPLFKQICKMKTYHAVVGAVWRGHWGDWKKPHVVGRTLTMLVG